MTGKDRSRYEISRHHAWAGLALLSIFLAIRYFIPFPDWFSLIVIFSLISYILIALAFTYKYSSALSEEQQPFPSEEVEKERIKAKLEKERMKLEKKRLKAQIKAAKKKK